MSMIIKQGNHTKSLQYYMSMIMNYITICDHALNSMKLDVRNQTGECAHDSNWVMSPTTMNTHLNQLFFIFTLDFSHFFKNNFLLQNLLYTKPFDFSHFFSNFLTKFILFPLKLSGKPKRVEVYWRNYWRKRRWEKPK